MSMFSDKYSKGGAANSAGVISSPGSMGGLGGFASNYGGAIVSGLSSMFAARSASKDAANQAKLTKEQAALNRTYEVEDMNYARANDLVDKKRRQALLNPYAGYKSA